MRSWVPRQIATVAGVLALSALSQSCIIASPDHLEEPERIPPRALIDTAVPSVTEIVQTDSMGNPTSFNVRFVSDDLGEPVVGRLFLNYPNGQFLGGAKVLPGALENEREMSVQWNQSRNVPVGCHTVTMTITHEDNYTAETPPDDKSKTAFVTWWIAHDTVDLQSVSLDECSRARAAEP